MTVTASEGQKEEKEVLSDPVPETLCRQVRTRASSVTPDQGLPLPVVTDGIRRAARTASLAARFGVAMLNKPGSLVHAQPATFAQARDRHHECAGHFGVPLVKGLRLLWGYIHLLVIKPALNLAEWITESPARFFITMAVGTVIWVFL